METVLQALRTARTSLRAVEAEDQLFADVTSVGLLVDKLPISSQDRWDHHIRTLGEDCSPQKRGEIFDAWLEEEQLVKHDCVRWQDRSPGLVVRRQEEEPAPAQVDS